MNTLTAEVKDSEIPNRAPRVTPELIASKIAKVDFHTFEGSMLTVCVLTLQNGFNVTGESACASPENFDSEIGERLALKQAENKIWALEGYLLKEQLYRNSNMRSVTGD